MIGTAGAAAGATGAAVPVKLIVFWSWLIPFPNRPPTRTTKSASKEEDTLASIQLQERMTRNGSPANAGSNMRWEM